MKKRKRSVLLFVLLLPCLATGQLPVWDWARKGGGSNYDYGHCIATDASGNTYVAGSFRSSTATFGSYTLSTPGIAAVFLAKYDPSGTVLWVRKAGSGGDTYPYGLCVDASGNVIVTGSFSGNTLTLGTTTVPGAGMNDVFLAKYSPSGNLLWARSAGGASEDLAGGAACDSTGAITLTGYFQGASSVFGNDTLHAAGIYDVFIARYDASGNAMWAMHAGGTAIDMGNGIACDSSGNILVCGAFSSASIVLGMDTLVNEDPSGNTGDMFVAKLAPAGTVLWAERFGGMQFDEALAVATGAGGTVYFTGRSRSAILPVGHDTLSCGGTYHVVLASLGTTGIARWALASSGNNDDAGRSMACDRGGSVFLAGTYLSSPFTMAALPIVNAGGFDAFFARFDTSGNIYWAVRAGGIGFEDGNGIAVTPSGAVVVTGSFQSSSVTFGTTILSNYGYDDAFVARMSPPPTGISEPLNGEALRIFPIPLSAEASVEFPAGYAGATLVLYNSLGLAIEKFVLPSRPPFIISRTGCPAGVYWIRITAPGKPAMTQKVIVAD
jgi:hypothetical protein